MSSVATERDIDAYLTAYGTPAEMIDRGLGIIESWADRCLTKVAEASGDNQIYGVLGRLSLKEKLDLFMPDGGTAELDDEYGERSIWEELYELIELRPAMDAENAQSVLRSWLDAHGWDDPSVDLPDVTEPFRSEYTLHTAIYGSLIYLGSWFEGLDSDN